MLFLSRGPRAGSCSPPSVGKFVPSKMMELVIALTEMARTSSPDKNENEAEEIREVMGIAGSIVASCPTGTDLRRLGYARLACVPLATRCVDALGLDELRSHSASASHSRSMLALRLPGIPAVLADLRSLEPNMKLSDVKI